MSKIAQNVILLLVFLLTPVLTMAKEPATPQATTVINQHTSLIEQLQQHPSDPALLYNYGVALYEDKEFKQAAEQFTLSAQHEENSALRGEARYNLGRALFAQTALAKNTRDKKQNLQQASTAFQQALHDNPTLDVARQSILQTRQALREIQQQQPKEQNEQNQQGQQDKQDQKEQEGQDGQESVQNKLDQASKKQQELNNKNTEQQPPPSQEKMDKMAGEQEALRKQLEALQKDLSKEDESQSQAEQVQKAIDKQKEAEDSLKQGKADQARKQQEEAAKQLQQSSQKADADDGQEEEELKPDNEDLPTENEPSLATDILENERRLHELRKEQMRKSRPYKGKDW